MVNITKRMHRLMPKLWQVKGGEGAAALPSNPAIPQLSSVVLRIPNPADGYDIGARIFWRRFLPAFRYHNLTVPIKVEQRTRATPDIAPTLTLTFEATDRETLSKHKAQPLLSDTESFAQWSEERRQEQREKRALEAPGARMSDATKESGLEQLRKKQEEIGIPSSYQTVIGEVIARTQAVADSSTPAPTMYQRTVTLGLRGRRAPQIWEWFESVTQSEQRGLSDEEKEAVQEYEEFQVRAEEDRQRVKKGIDAMKKEKEDLKRAKEAAQRLAEA